MIRSTRCTTRSWPGSTATPSRGSTAAPTISWAGCAGWQDTLGEIRRGVVENDSRKWSGDHCATATEISGGVLFTSRPLSKPDPHITDLAPTVLELLAVPVPEEIDGEPVL